MEITAAALAAELCGASQEDPLLAVLKLSGGEANDEVVSTLVEVVSHESDQLASYTVGVVRRHKA